VTSERKIIDNRVNARDRRLQDAFRTLAFGTQRVASMGSIFHCSKMFVGRRKSGLWRHASREKPPPPELLALALKVAEARIELSRIRANRREMIDTAYRDPDFWPRRKKEISRLGGAPRAQGAKRDKGADNRQNIEAYVRKFNAFTRHDEMTGEAKQI
jgi:hypothetical protein